jgi:UDP-glucose 4-epimerase
VGAENTSGTQINSDIFRLGKTLRILVTGGAGFIGSHVVDAYVQSGHEVWVLDDLSRGKREQVNPRAKFIRMDIRSPAVKDLLGEARFDCINHHARQIDVRASVMDPARDAMINVLGTLNLLEAARTQQLLRIIFASTGGAIYGEQCRFPANEQHPAVPRSPYGVAKRAVELYLDYYRQVHGLRYVVLRYANVYGPRQDPEGEAGVVAIFCGRILHGQRLFIYGTGEQTRDYVHVGDVARANLLALNYLDSITQRTRRTPETGPANVFNIGTGVETSVNALAAMLLDTADADCPVVHLSARPGEQMRSVIDPSLAETVLGWRPLTVLSDGLAQTLAWFPPKEVDGTQPPTLSVGAAGNG